MWNKVTIWGRCVYVCVYVRVGVERGNSPGAAAALTSPALLLSCHPAVYARYDNRGRVRNTNVAAAGIGCRPVPLAHRPNQRPGASNHYRLMAC